MSAHPKPRKNAPFDHPHDEASPPRKRTTRTTAARRVRWKWLASGLAVGLVVAILLAITGAFPMSNAAPPVFPCEVIASYPHAEDAFTQGLIYKDGFFYEGTGGHGESSLRKVQVSNGEVVQRVDLDPRFFGEGIAVVDGKIYQLTWRSRVGFIYDQETFERQGEFAYTGEGWGLTYDGKHLVMSDGTDVLRFLDPLTFREARRLRVTSGGRQLYKINELEFANGFIYANLWHSDYLVKIAPDTGRVAAWFDLRGLWPSHRRSHREAVLNGIAHHPATGNFFVTGKNWPQVFEVRLAEQPSSRGSATRPSAN